MSQINSVAAGNMSEAPKRAVDGYALVDVIVRDKRRGVEVTFRVDLGRLKDGGTPYEFVTGIRAEK
jgi:hypothetical protein